MPKLTDYDAVREDTYFDAAFGVKVYKVRDVSVAEVVERPCFVVAKK